ncbi:glycosyltransferase involved in cell wall biosynthesis [Virgibacillus litoralis]|uniref:Glycosyltransferase involved in cell wall biosynthesis n=2 Tax=Virgibacillus litoralis TaxID=578221 RepID=A0ABS4HD16_9BACI|nr:glycosyltransferase involved in cell wall biosynthesis [Virgibacillus litoralis]
MGFDIPGNPSQSQNVVRNFLSTDYILSPNNHTTMIFTESYKLNGIYEGTIIEEGYPRIDLTLNTNPKRFSADLRSQGLRIDNSKENILYAPTWKGSHISKVDDDVDQIIADISYLENEIGNNYNILIKVHPFLYKEALKHDDIKNKLVPDLVDTNELLATIDILITDYSSIFFDFLVTNKPILFYTWDIDSYDTERGQYLANDELPGPLVFNPIELVDTIKNIDKVITDFREKYINMQQIFTGYEDGKVTERVVRNIFNKTTENLNTISSSSPQKKKILIYSGGMKDNGITSSFINLMSNIDYSKYDVSCFTATPHDDEVIKNLGKVNKNVRFLFKPGLPVYRLSEVYKDKFIHNRGASGFLGRLLFPENAYIREHTRLFGKNKYDYVIDFSGYSLFWAKFLVVTDAKRKICFMHNDLLSDSERTINGKRPHRINLRGLFSIYNRFDLLVSVSKGTMELNRKNLSQYAEFNKFEYVMNSIKPDKILQMATENVSYEEINNEDIITTEKYKARAIVSDYKNSILWNTLSNDQYATQLHLKNEYDNAEITISRKAILNNTTYYQFSHAHQVIGWINSEAITLLPDDIIYEKNVNRLAKLTRPKGNHIFSDPYDIAGCEKVSSSWDYRYKLLKIDKEAKTQHSIYSRISINKTVIGWVDNSALNFYEFSSIRRTVALIRNYQKYRSFIKNIENRTLSEINIKENMFAIVTNPGDYIIWTKAYPNYDTKEIANATDFEGKTIKIKTIHKTRQGYYYLFYSVNVKIGWLNYEAVTIIDNPKIIEENNVSRTAKICLRESDHIWSKPYGIQGAQKTIDNLDGLEGSTVSIDKEVITQAGDYSHIIKDGVSIGWLDNRSLTVKKVFGIELDGQYIPEPSEKDINFVNMGRLSPEKGQDNLIKAFANFHSKHPNSKLYFLGHGPLKADLQTLIDDFDLNDSIHLLGQLENPFSFMNKCDCFVLSSHYEGQPMVLLEAMTLGMDILATDIVANRTVLEDGKYGWLVENSVSGLEEGLYTIANKQNVHTKEKFDYIKYNSEAMATFYKKFE